MISVGLKDNPKGYLLPCRTFKEKKVVKDFEREYDLGEGQRVKPTPPLSSTPVPGDMTEPRVKVRGPTN